MEPYGTIRHCVKCGAAGGTADDAIMADPVQHKTVYVPPCVGKVNAPEYIKRTCWRCGYTWKEKPRDVNERTKNE